MELITRRPSTLRLTASVGTSPTYADLAEVSLAGRTHEAAEALEQALARYERQGNVVMSERTRTRLAEFRQAAPR
jgi:hypothetical protein